MSVFPAKIERKFSPVQTLFCHLPLIIIICIRANWRHWDLWYTTTWIAIGKVQYWMFPLTTILLRHSFVFLLKAPVQLPWSCYFLHYFLRYSAIILLSIAYNSSQDGIIATWQILNENTKQPTLENKPVRIRINLVIISFFACKRLHKYLFIS